MTRNEKLKGKEKIEKGQVKGLAQPEDVDPKEIGHETEIDFSFLPEEVKNALAGVADDYKVVDGQGFDVNQNYDDNGNFEIGDNAKRVMTSISAIQPLLEKLGDDTDDFMQGVDDFIKNNTTNLQALGQLVYFFSVMQSYFTDRGSQRVIKYLTKQVKYLHEEEQKRKEEQEHQETIDTQDKMVTMLLGLTSMPTTKEGLIKYGEHLDEMKVFLADEKQFEKVIHGFIDAVEDSKDDKETKNKKNQLYQSLIVRFDGLKALVGQIETVIYGQGAEALVASVGERSVEDLVKDAQFVHNLNGVIHMQQGEFNKLVTMFGDTANKSSVMKLIKAYLVASGEISQVNSQNIADIRCVDGAGSHASKGKIFEPYDAQGKIIEKASVRFGVKKEIVDKTGKSILSYPPAQIAEMFNQNENGIPNTFKKAFTDMLNPSTSDEKDAEGKPRKSFSDALAAMRNSGVWRELQKIFLSLDGMDGKMSEASTVQLDHLHVLDGIEKAWKENKDNYKKYFKPGEDISQFDIIAAVNAYKFASYQVTDENNKVYQTTDTFKGEKRFFDLLSVSEQIRYVLSNKERSLIQQGENKLKKDDGTSGVKLKHFETQYKSVKPAEEDDKLAGQAPVGVEIAPGGKVSIESLKRDESHPGVVELYADGDDATEPYLLVDGHAVGLSIDASGKAIGSYAILAEGGVIMTKRIIVSLAVGYEPARIEVSDVTLSNPDDQNAFDYQLYDKEANKWNMQLFTDKYKKDRTFGEKFIAQTLVFNNSENVNINMQKRMAELHRDIFALEQEYMTDEVIKTMIESAKTDFEDIIARDLSTTTPPTQEDAKGTVKERYDQFKFS